MANNYYTSPRGKASYPKLQKPDTKFNAEGIYSTKLVISKEDAAEFIARIEEVFVDEFGPKKLTLLQRPYKEDAEGDLVFNFKSKNKPQLFNAAGKPIKAADLKLGSGSTLKIKGSIAPTLVQGKHYATLWMNSVQVIDLVEFAGGAGFGAEEGGSYMGGDSEETAEAANAAVADAKEDF